MRDVLRPLELMLLCFAGVLTERDHLINLYVLEENRILREQMGTRPRLNDDQRRRLTVLGKRLGRKPQGSWSVISFISRSIMRPHDSRNQEDHQADHGVEQLLHRILEHPRSTDCQVLGAGAQRGNAQ